MDGLESWEIRGIFLAMVGILVIITTNTRDIPLVTQLIDLTSSDL